MKSIDADVLNKEMDMISKRSEFDEMSRHVFRLRSTVEFRCGKVKKNDRYTNF